MFTCYGIRHHGPGCARSLRSALEHQKPDLLLVEGPPEANALIELVGHAQLQTPVALLIYQTGKPESSAFYPFAEFSPEWQALRFANLHGIPARFFDLPMVHVLAREQPEPNEDQGEDAAAPRDPLGELAHAAGAEDSSSWWDSLIEQRCSPPELFTGIAESMTAVRAHHPAPNAHEAQREAAMRQALRAAQKEGFSNIAVVCGAYHVPALLAPSKAGVDAALLKGLAKVKVEAAWVPWTQSRLSIASAYGAGMAAPAWYRDCHLAGPRAHVRYLARFANALRLNDLDAASASVIEAVRLSETLAAMRGASLPGLAELRDAAQAILCRGELSRFLLVQAAVEIDEAIGQVPDDAPKLPLRQDFEAQLAALRLKRAEIAKTLDLDLRTPLDARRSHFFYRLSLLGLKFARYHSGESQGSFREIWELKYDPADEIALLSASYLGNDIAEASAKRLLQGLGVQPNLRDCASALDQAVLAELPACMPTLMRHIAMLSVGADMAELLNALPPLLHLVRYGSVRAFDVTPLLPLIEVMLERVVVGLVAACQQQNRQAAETRLEALINLQAALGSAEKESWRTRFEASLDQLAEAPGVHALLLGFATRTRVDRGSLSHEELIQQARRALSAGVPAPDAAAWLEGLLRGPVQLLLHQRELLGVIDGWLQSLDEERFIEVLTLVRRAFAQFDGAERTRIAGALAREFSAGSGPVGDAQLDAERVAQVMATFQELYG